MAYLGGCYCGEIRYTSDQGPVEKGYCHCSMCRKTTGAPVLAFASFPVETFVYTKGLPQIFKSSSWGQREFCGTYGTQICYRQSEGAESVDVNLGSLDEINAVSPDHHIYEADRVEWLKIDDEFPKFEENSKL